jgi:hypothetical protein
MPRPPDSSWFYHMDNIWLGIHVMNLLLIQSWPVPCYVYHLRLDIFLNTHIKQQAKFWFCVFLMHMGLGGPQRRSGRFGEENKSLTPTGSWTTISQLDCTKPSYYTDYAVLTVAKLILNPNKHEAWCLFSCGMWRYGTGWLVSDVSLQRGGLIFKGRNVQLKTRRSSVRPPRHAATHPRITENSTAPLRKPKNSQAWSLFCINYGSILSTNAG